VIIRAFTVSSIFRASDNQAFVYGLGLSGLRSVLYVSLVRPMIVRSGFPIVGFVSDFRFFPIIFSDPIFDFFDYFFGSVTGLKFTIPITVVRFFRLR
jgi:hypothetical protein